MDNSDINIKIGIEDSNVDQVIQKIRQKLSNTSFLIKVDQALVTLLRQAVRVVLRAVTLQTS